MAGRGYEPAEGTPQSMSKPQLKQTTPTPNAPSVEPSPTRVSGRGNEQPVARPGGNTGQIGSRPTLTVEPSDARVRGRGDELPTL